MKNKLPSREKQFRKMIDLLEKASEDKPITTRQLAKKLGVAFTTVQRWLAKHEVHQKPVREGERGPTSVGMWV